MKIKRMGAVFFLVVCVFCGCGKHEISHEKKRAERIRRIQKGNGKGRNNTRTGRIRSL